MATSKGVRRTNFVPLPVENVQSLASKNLKDIPLRYIRPEFESDGILADESLQIPVIDMSKLVSGQFEYDDELQKLHLACKDWGFFQLVNHGASEAIEKMKVVTEEFFKLPLEEKMVCAQPPRNIEGYGQAFVLSEDQKLDWGDMLFLYPLPVSKRNMTLWPENPTSIASIFNTVYIFRSTFDEYSAELHKVSLSLFTLMEINLGVEPEKISSLFEQDCKQGIRMNYYPPCIHANKVIGITPHSDPVGMTLLIQVNEVQGLQIKKNDKWIPINPIPGAVIVNIGDIMEIISNGEYKSIEHRAVVHYEKERLSIAAFHNPDMATNIGPLPELVKNNEPNYKTISSQDFLRLTISWKLDGIKPLDHIRINNGEHKV